MKPQRRRERRGTAEELNAITETIIGAAMAVHRELGPGLLESAYEACLEHELSLRQVPVLRQVRLPLIYRGVEFEDSYRLDLFVAGEVVVEVKAVERLQPVHDAQVLTYLKLTGCHVGLLLNFNVPVLKDGIRRLVNDFPDLCATQRSQRLCGEGSGHLS